MNATALNWLRLKRFHLIPIAALALLLVAPAFEALAQFQAPATSYPIYTPPPPAPSIEAAFDWMRIEERGHYRDFPGVQRAADGYVYYEGFVGNRCYLDPESCDTHPWVVRFSAANPNNSLVFDWVIGGTVQCDGNAQAANGYVDLQNITCRFPTQGTYPVTLKVRVKYGFETGTITKDVRIRDLLIVSIGDSIASGEGNPHILAGKVSCFAVKTSYTGYPSCVDQLRALRHSEWQIERMACYPGNAMSIVDRWTCIVSPQWQDVQCHRSTAAGPAHAARAIARSDPKSTVTFLHLACSGATIDNGLLEPYLGQEWISFTCLSDPEAGVCKDELHPVAADARHLNLCPYPKTYFGGTDQRHRTCYRLLPPQVDQVARAVCRHALGSDEDGHTTETCRLGEARPIDALLLSVGANDINFGKIATACAMFGHCNIQQQSDFYPSELNQLIRAVQNVDDRLRELPGRYERLEGKLTEKLDVKNIFITEYPDPTKDEQGNYCTHALDNALDYAADIKSELEIGFALALYWPAVNFDGLTFDEMLWADIDVVGPLNVEVNATRSRFGWIPVSGLQAAFRTHGVCSSDRWVLTLDQSSSRQRDIDGVLHPNNTGHLEYGNAIFNAVRPRLAQ